jgi:hypothetical protein
VAEPTFDFAEGWPVAYAQAGGQTPEREVFNRLFQRLYALGYDVTRFGGGLPWDATINYAVLALVMGADGELYFGKRASGPDVDGGAVDPTADDGSCWEPMRKNASEFELAIDNGNVAWELSAAPQAVLTLTTDATLAAPISMVAGAEYSLRVVQDATGGWTPTWDAVFAGDIPVVPSAAGEEIVYRWYCTGTELVCLGATITRSFHNLLINGSFGINQRGFAGGALTAGDYGHDRWKAGDFGATYTVTDGVLSLTAGSIVQVVEAPRLAGKTVTLFAAVSSGTVTGSVAGVSGTLPLTVTVPTAATGDINVELSGAASLTDVALIKGNAPTEYPCRQIAEELALCQRYYWRSQFGSATIRGISAVAGAYKSVANISLPVTMRAVPSLSVEGPWAFYLSGSYVEGATEAYSLSRSMAYVSVSNSNNDNNSNYVLRTNFNEVIADAEL